MFCINCSTTGKVLIKRNSPAPIGYEVGDGILGVVVGVALDVVGKDCEDIVGSSMATEVNKRFAPCNHCFNDVYLYQFTAVCAAVANYVQ